MNYTEPMKERQRPGDLRRGGGRCHLASEGDVIKSRRAISARRLSLSLSAARARARPTMKSPGAPTSAHSSEWPRAGRIHHTKSSISSRTQGQDEIPLDSRKNRRAGHLWKTVSSLHRYGQGMVERNGDKSDGWTGERCRIWSLDGASGCRDKRSI